MQCGKIFKNTALVNFHAEKSGHDQFEESTEEVTIVINVSDNDLLNRRYYLGETTYRRRKETEISRITGENG